MPVTGFLPPTWAPASGLAGTATDLLAFCLLHTGAHTRAGAVLDAEHRALMHTPAADADAFGMADGWGLGLAGYGDPDGPWLGHDGTVDGASCAVRFSPRTGTAVAMTANASTGTRLWSDVLRELRAFGIHVADYAATIPAAIPPAAAGAVLGDYANGTTVFSVRPHEDGVRLSDRTGLLADLEMHEHHYFSARRVDAATAPFVGRFVASRGTRDITVMQLAGRSARRVAAAG